MRAMRRRLRRRANNDDDADDGDQEDGEREQSQPSPPFYDFAQLRRMQDIEYQQALNHDRMQLLLRNWSAEHNARKRTVRIQVMQRDPGDTTSYGSQGLKLELRAETPLDALLTLLPSGFRVRTQDDALTGEPAREVAELRAGGISDRTLLDVTRGSRAPLVIEAVAQQPAPTRTKRKSTYVIEGNVIELESTDDDDDRVGFDNKVSESTSGHVTAEQLGASSLHRGFVEPNGSRNIHSDTTHENTRRRTP